MLIYVIAWQFYHKIQVLLEEKISPVNEYFYKHHTSAPSVEILGLKCKDYDCKMCWAVVAKLQRIKLKAIMESTQYIYHTARVEFCFYRPWKGDT